MTRLGQMRDQAHISSSRAHEMPAQGRKSLKVVLTGFGAFPGAPFNPSQTLALAMHRHSRARLQRAGIDLEVVILPVVFSAIPSHLAAIKAKSQPDIVLHLGLAARRKKITIETRARNHLSVLHCDAEGRRALAPQIEAEGPPVRRVSLPYRAVLGAMSGKGVRIALSQDAGDYICNQTLFLSLSLFEQAGFIHLPKPRALNRKRASSARQAPPLRAMIAALERALLCLARPCCVKT